ncbi:MAG: Mu-like prophage major head subunit gpT family protein [Gammaproteobacteria bacterium]|nr:Mu-like prophage major head subunit gpT family protein [Gammaproteobacteria bacterium]
MTTNFRSGARISGGTRDISAALEGMRRAREVLALGGKATDDLTRDFLTNCSLREMLRMWAETYGFGEILELPHQRAIARAIEISEAIRREGHRNFGHGTATFTDILSSHASKAMLRGWENAEHSWSKVARISTLPNLKTTTRVGLSEMLLAKVQENGEIPQTLRDDRAEHITASTFAGMFNITREALVNDDLEVMYRMPFEAGISASATINARFWEIVTSASGVGPTLRATSRALFNATDGNYTASGGAPTVAALNTARAAMRKQKDPVTNRRLNIAPAIVCVPPELEGTARVLVASEHIDGADGNLAVVVEPSLSDATNGDTAWYLFADPERFDTFDVGLLDENGPLVDSKPGWSVDGIMNRVRIDFGVAALDFRGVYRNKGA